MNYVEPQLLQQYAEAPEADSPDVWEQLAAAASRIFDKACEVPDNFFAKAGTSATTKIFRGNNTDYLRLAPYVAGTLSLVESLDVDDVATTVSADDYFERDGYLVYPRAPLGNEYYRVSPQIGYFRAGLRYRVTARWGFTEIPADVKQAVIELALFIWRRKDLAFSEMSGISSAAVTAQVPPTCERVAQHYRDRYSENSYFA